MISVLLVISEDFCVFKADIELAILLPQQVKFWIYRNVHHLHMTNTFKWKLVKILCEVIMIRRN